MTEKVDLIIIKQLLEAKKINKLNEFLGKLEDKNVDINNATLKEISNICKNNITGENHVYLFISKNAYNLLSCTEIINYIKTPWFKNNQEIVNKINSFTIEEIINTFKIRYVYDGAIEKYKQVLNKENWDAIINHAYEEINKGNLDIAYTEPSSRKIDRLYHTLPNHIINKFLFEYKKANFSTILGKKKFIKNYIQQNKQEIAPFESLFNCILIVYPLSQVPYKEWHNRQKDFQKRATKYYNQMEIQQYLVALIDNKKNISDEWITYCKSCKRKLPTIKKLLKNIAKGQI